MSSALAAVTAATFERGPLVALFDRAERHHDRVAERVKEPDAPSPRPCAGARGSDVVACALLEGARRHLGAHREWGAERRIPDR
jgi:hypothetical protein